MNNVLIPLSNRASAIKMAPVVHALTAAPEFNPVIVTASKHYQQLQSVLANLGLESDFDLAIEFNRQRGYLDELGSLLTNFQTVLNAAQPQLILVLGDSLTALAASLAGFYNHLPVAHIEAGLRTFDKWAPFPDEMHRQLADNLADLYFAPTEGAKEHLLAEGRPEERVIVSGNPIVDVVRNQYREDFTSDLLDQLPPDRQLLLTTVGRVENSGRVLDKILRSVRDIVETNPQVELVCPLEPNSDAYRLAQALFSHHERIHLVPVMPLGTFINTVARSYLIVTDSAGTVEEASVFHKPVLLLREKTERVEAVYAQTARVVGTDPLSIQQALFELLTDKRAYREMQRADENLFGDGHAAERIVAALRKWQAER